MDEKLIDRFEKCEGKLEALYDEIGLLSKKKPTDAVSKFKLKFINAVVTDANDILGESYRPFADFDVFDEDDCPTSSDVVMILSQYLCSMDKLRQDNTEHYGGGQYIWIGTSKRRAKPPRIARLS